MSHKGEKNTLIMQNRLYETIGKLYSNSHNYITFFTGNRKTNKSFSEFIIDVDYCISKLFSINPYIKTVAIIGPTSYSWMVIDIACLKAGILLIAIPEFLSSEEQLKIIKDLGPDLLLKDDCINMGTPTNIPIFDYNVIEQKSIISNNFDVYQPPKNIIIQENKILQQYSIAFSSGTSGNLKVIPLEFQTERAEVGNKLINQSKKFIQLLQFQLSFWSSQNNKLLVFMPFSHHQQRAFIRMALMLNINIVLSDPQNCVRHLILEKPNIMISVPAIYEALSNSIKIKLRSLSSVNHFLFKIFLFVKINSFSNSNIIKKVFGIILFEDLRKVYGGKGDYFVTGSAPIKKETLELFYKVGVRVYEAYGQSELGIISMNSRKHFRLGSVGKPRFEIKIDSNSEILVKFDEREHSYAKNCLIIDDQNFIHTGDSGYLDKDGYLYVTGRIDSVIVLKNGKKIFPEGLEKRIPLSQAILIKKMDHLALIYHDLRNNEEVVQIIQEFNASLPEYSRVREYCKSEPFTIESGLLTSTLKPKRNKIISKYQHSNFVRI